MDGRDLHLNHRYDAKGHVARLLGCARSNTTTPLQLTPDRHAPSLETRLCEDYMDRVPRNLLEVSTTSCVHRLRYLLGLTEVTALVILYKLATSPFVYPNRTKPWKRVVGDTAFRHIAVSLNTAQVQYVLGETRSVYEGWAKKRGLPLTVEELQGGARLLWIGPKRLDRVLLYVHGTLSLIASPSRFN